MSDGQDNSNPTLGVNAAVGADIPFTPQYSELYPKFLYHNIVPSADPKHRNTLLVKTEKISDDGENTTIGRIIYCRDAIEKGLCLRGSNCKYSHPYEYERNPTLALRLDHIISHLNELHIMLDLPSRCTEPPRKFVDRFSSHNNIIDRPCPPSLGRNESRPSTSGSESQPPEQQPVTSRRDRGSSPRRGGRRGRGRGRSITRSISSDRLNRGSSNQLLSLTERLTKSQP
ncbi:unnamed protein product [Phaedon cochleariae]|uniref:C3H1-type domain-containing protein n=1 Tax=Phaedon cochleariae TaxID=80249 RepID=A0A9N9SJB6_PHACE|nr:unnamed protein product [Phaedon cochleariae]